MPLGGMRQDRNCHAERSEASQPMWGRDPFAALRVTGGKFLSSAEAEALSRSEGEAISLLRYEGDCFASFLATASLRFTQSLL